MSIKQNMIMLVFIMFTAVLVIIVFMFLVLVNLAFLSVLLAITSRYTTSLCSSKTNSAK